jgi:hypothetical protein
MNIRRLLMSLGAVLSLTMLFGVGSASAVVQRDLIATFGPDGTPNTFFRETQFVSFQQASNRVYVMPARAGGEAGTEEARGLYSFEIPSPLTYVPRGAPFPLPMPNLSGAGSMAIDNSNTASAGRVYMVDAGFATLSYLTGWEADGTELGLPFPVIPGPEPYPANNRSGPRFCSATVGPDGTIYGSDQNKLKIRRFTNQGVPLESLDTEKFQKSPPCFMAMDSHNDLFVSSRDTGTFKYLASSNYTEAEPYLPGGSPMTIDKSDDHLFRAEGNHIGEYDDEGNLLREFGDTFDSTHPAFTWVTVDESTDEVYAADERGKQIRVYGPPRLLPKLRTDRPKSVSTTGAVLVGHVDLDGGPEVTECFFQYGLDENFETGTAPCTPGGSFSDPTDVSAQVNGLSPESTYFFRLVARTSEGVGVGNTQTFIATDPPLIKNVRILEVTADHALLQAEINPRGVAGTWHIEFGPEPCQSSDCESSESEGFVECTFSCPQPPKTFFGIEREISGLEPGTRYDFRFVGVNDQNGVGNGEEHTFTTFPLDPGGVDTCSNAHARRISGASKLSHCRGYELVSAADAGGYDVASNIVEGEEPLEAYPNADDRFLYTTSVGKLPGIAGNPVNLGTDPYVATREGEKGWVTRYAGLPATLPSDSPFASTASGADAGLTDFAFGAPDRCSPCFGDGSTGIPLRMPNGSLVQGMAGSIPVTDPEPAGKVNKQLSADGAHFVFGSEQKFEQAGNSGSLSIYERNLDAGTTQVVSTLPNGTTMSGDPAELDISADGSRVLIGVPVAEDPLGNKRYDLYMHVGNSPNSVPVADTTDGVYYDGMNEDGTIVYFTSDESLGDDADASPDIFRALVGSSSASVARVSTGSGGTGNEDDCEPPEDWNVMEGGPNCGALAFAGGAGVASGDGTLYFMSPELLDGPSNGIQNQPNVYIVRANSTTPAFVGTIDDSHAEPPPSPPRHPVITKSFGGEHIGASAVAVDETNGDVYVFETWAGRLSRFDEEGDPEPFTEGSGAGTNRMSTEFAFFDETGIAVDSHSGSPFEGDFYVRGYGPNIFLYAHSGKELGEISGMGYACGLAVDQATGDLYVGDRSLGGIRKFHPISNATPVTNADYEETQILTQGVEPCQVAAGGGFVYASRSSEGPLRRYPMSEFAASPPSLLGTQVTPTSRNMYVDAETGEVFVIKEKAILVFTSDENEEQPIAQVGLGSIGERAYGVAVNGKTHHVFATADEEHVVHLGYEPVPYHEILHPGVVHAKQQPEVHSYEDFQVTPGGDDAAFATLIKLTDRSTDGNHQVYRFDAPQDRIDCVSCTPTNAITRADAFLSPNGLNIDDGGRVYFTSPEQLTLRDTNRRTDAYEWEELPGAEQGRVNLISTGTGVVNAALASVDHSGKNAYFYTRESIIPQDDNGPTMKVYTAREGGGYSYLPEEIPCQSADECRGPSTVAAPPPNIGTYEGRLGNVGETKSKTSCGRHRVRRRGRCVKVKHRRNRHRHRHRSAHRRNTRHGSSNG